MKAIYDSFGEIVLKEGFSPEEAKLHNGGKQLPISYWWKGNGQQIYDNFFESTLPFLDKFKEDGSDMKASMFNEIPHLEELKKPANIEIVVNCLISEIFYGTVKTIRYNQEYPDSNNLIVIWNVEKQIVISAGHNEKVNLVFKGDGNYGIQNHRSDLIIKFEIVKDHLFSKKENTLIMTYTTSLASALKSDPLQFEIFSLDGKMEKITYPVD